MCVCMCLHAHKRWMKKMHRLITLIFAYFSDKIKEDRVGRICSMRGIGKKFIRIFITIPKGNRLQGLPSLIKLYCIGIGCERVDCALLDMKGSSGRGLFVRIVQFLESLSLVKQNCQNYVTLLAHLDLLREVQVYESWPND